MQVGKHESAPATLSNGDQKITNLLGPKGELIVGGLAGVSAALEVKPALSATATLTNVAQNAASVTLLALNVARLGFVIVNDSAAALFVKYGTTASSSSFTNKLLPGQQMNVNTPWDGWTGRIDGIWDAAGAGNARITELTA